MTFAEAMARIQARADPPATPSYNGDDDMKAMLAEFDLLALIQSDTGETGRRSGGRIDFTSCPICGHRDCFSYFTKTNSWSCFGASNASGYEGGTAIEYYKATRTDDDTEAVKWLREETGHPYQGKQSADDEPSANQGEQDGTSDGFPPITPSMATEPPKRAPVMIDGILRQGHTLLVTARSKAGKTFLMLQLAVAVACGERWLGRDCRQGRVLFVNPEVDPPSAENRLHDVAEAMAASLEAVKENVDFWHLRGHVQGIKDTARALYARVKRGDYALIIFDSVYELYEGDENSADDARKFFHVVDEIAKRLDCSIAMTHHHAKGIRADLDALDRGSGSGVFGRKPDAPLDMIQVFPPSDDDTTLDPGVTAWRVSDSGLREFPGIDPFNVFFKYPRHLLDFDGVTSEWKPKSGYQAGGKKTGEKNKQKSSDRAERCITALLAEFVARGRADGIPATEAAEIVSESIGETVKAQTLKTYVEKSEQLDVDQVSQKRWQVTPKKSPPPSLELEQL